jgi:hypothetical protein
VPSQGSHLLTLLSLPQLHFHMNAYPQSSCYALTIQRIREIAQLVWLFCVRRVFRGTFVGRQCSWVSRNPTQTQRHHLASKSKHMNSSSVAGAQSPLARLLLRPHIASSRYEAASMPQARLRQVLHFACFLNTQFQGLRDGIEVLWFVFVGWNTELVGE